MTPDKAKLAVAALESAGLTAKKLKKLAGRHKPIIVLVIDEIFRADAKLFTLLDIVLRGSRECYAKPFGGIAVLGVGDPLQGAAVPDNGFLAGECCGKVNGGLGSLSLKFTTALLPA